MSSLYYKGAHAALIVYSVTDDSSFRSLEEWIKQLDEHGNIDKMVRFIVANKKDVPKSERRVEFRDGNHFADTRKY